MRKTLVVLGCTMLGAVAALALTVIWDEAIDGDLSDSGLAPTPVGMVDSQNVIMGIVGGPSALGRETGPEAERTEAFDDGYDCYTFTVPAGFTMDQVVLVDYVPTTGNTSSGWNLYSGPDTSGTFLESPLLTVAAIGTNILSAPLAAGIYTVEIREFGTEDNVYELDHQIPGLPVELQSLIVE